MSHAPTVDASEVAVDLFLRELGLEEDLRARCGDAGDAGGEGAVVPSYEPGRLAVGDTAQRFDPDSCELVPRVADTGDTTYAPGKTPA